MELNQIFDTSKNFVRYEGLTAEGKEMYAEFEFKALEGWNYRFGRVGFPPINDTHIGFDEDRVKNKVIYLLGTGYSEVNKEDAPITEGQSKDVKSFHDWLKVT